MRINRALVKASKHYRTLQSTLLAELDLHPGQDVLVWHLSRHPEGLTVSELAETIGIEPPTVTRSLNRLGDDTWFTREGRPGDRRTVVIRPTKRTLEAAGDIAAVWEKLAGTATAGFTQAERDQLAGALERVRDNFTEAGVIPDADESERTNPQ